jgi:hypothetical protein
VWFLYGATGYGSRLTLSMNVKTGKEIGHPSSNYIWDVLSFAENCLSNTGITWRLFIGNGYAGSSRKTSAQTDQKISNRVQLINQWDLKLNLQDGPIVYAHPDGNWYFSDKSEDFAKSNFKEMPFGPVIFQILDVDESDYQFPYLTLKYLLNTLERGEEPMETAGLGNYSAVSGWKAYARWMQAYSIPLRGIKHEYLKNTAELLYEMRKEFVTYWHELHNRLKDNKEKEFALDIAQCYQAVLPILSEIKQDGESINLIRNLYFTEQRTLPIYKKLSNWIKFVDKA